MLNDETLTTPETTEPATAPLVIKKRTNHRREATFLRMELNAVKETTLGPEALEKLRTDLHAIRSVMLEMAHDYYTNNADNINDGFDYSEATTYRECRDAIGMLEDWEQTILGLK